MTTDIVCYYAENGLPYLPLMRRMYESAHDIMPDVSVKIVTPTPDEKFLEIFDEMVVVKASNDRKISQRLCLEKVRSMATYMIKFQRRTIFIDPDVVFHQEPVFDGSFDIGLLWRDQKPDQPINTGMILAEPGFRDFWWHYGNIAVNLPEQVHWWWCDQLAFTLMTSVFHKAGEMLTIDNARVKLLDARLACAPPDEALPGCWAIHYKGALKGEGWEKVFPGRQSADGKFSAASVFSMDTARAPS